MAEVSAGDGVLLGGMGVWLGIWRVWGVTPLMTLVMERQGSRSRLCHLVVGGVAICEGQGQ